jgi:hypothetical protein
MLTLMSTLMPSIVVVAKKESRSLLIMLVRSVSMRVAVGKYESCGNHDVVVVTVLKDGCWCVVAARCADDGVGLLADNLVARMTLLVGITVCMAMSLVEVTMIIVGRRIG